MQSNLNFKNLEIAKGYIPFRANKWKLWDKMGQKKILAHSVTLLLSENKSNKIFITLCKGPFLYRSMFFFFFGSFVSPIPIYWGIRSTTDKWYLPLSLALEQIPNGLGFISYMFLLLFKQYWSLSNPFLSLLEKWTSPFLQCILYSQF